MRLLDYAHNIHSQNGEDGILGKILDFLPSEDKWCVEFGACDGKYFSNTCDLIERRKYSAVPIEPVRARFAQLKANYAANPNVITLNRFAGITPEDHLGHILVPTPIPKDFNLLTIDVEGNDHHIWDALTSYAPNVVHIPYNSTIPSEVDFVQPADVYVSQGPSLLVLVRLGRQKK